MWSFHRSGAYAVTILKIANGALIAPRQPTPFATPQPDSVSGWSPNPTKAPFYDRYGFMQHKNLFQRQENTDLTDAHICGWTSGISNSPISCPGETSACGYLVQSGPPFNVGCCPYTQYDDAYLRPDFNGCPWTTSCVAYSAQATPVSGGDIVTDIDAHAISCPSQLPECQTLFLDGPDTSTYLSFGCGTVATSYSAIQSIVIREATVTVTSFAIPEASLGGSGTGDSQLNAATSNPSPSPTSTSSPTNVGAIAGGTVGGVVGLSIIAGVVGYLAWKKKKARKAPMREVSQYTGSTY